MSAQTHLENMPVREFFNSDKGAAEAMALSINAAGGFAWVESEYGSDMGHDNVFWGYRCMFFTPQRVFERMQNGMFGEAKHLTNAD